MRASDFLIAGRPEEALDWYRRRRRGVIGKPILVAQWARLLAALGALDELSELMADLVQDPNQHLFGIGQTIKRARRDGADERAAVATLGLPVRPALVERLAEQLSVSVPPPIRHLAICGVSFCGSTVMSEMLASSGAANIGESHWIGRSSVDGRLRTLGFDGGPEMQTMEHCVVCGPACRYLTEDFRLGLVGDPSHWYRKIAARLGTEALISADKNLSKYAMLDPELDLGAVVLFKSPWNAWASQRARLGNLGAAQDAKNLQLYLTNWQGQYRVMLDRLSPGRGRIIVPFEAFERSPEAYLQAIRAFYDIPNQPMEAAILNHSIGGNGGANRRLRSNRDVVQIPRRELPSDHVDWIAKHAGAMELYAELKAASTTSFPSIAKGGAIRELQDTGG